MTDGLRNVEFLIGKNVLPSDSLILSEHNNLVVSSENNNSVSRITTKTRIATNTDPGDFYYSHHIGWELGASGGVVSPTEEEPVEFEDFVISTFPKMETISWDKVDARSLLSSIKRLNGWNVNNIYTPEIVRNMNVGAYSQARLSSLPDATRQNPQANRVQDSLDYYRRNYNFANMALSDQALVHGDLHSGNIVMDENGTPLFIDLDSVAIGPRTYDLASWCVRAFRGDPAPILEASEIALSNPKERYDSASFKAMVGWKVLSSMTHTLKYDPANTTESLRLLCSIATTLNAPGEWNYDR